MVVVTLMGKSKNLGKSLRCSNLWACWYRTAPWCLFFAMCWMWLSLPFCSPFAALLHSLPSWFHSPCQPISSKAYYHPWSWHRSSPFSFKVEAANTPQSYTVTSSEANTSSSSLSIPTSSPQFSALFALSPWPCWPYNSKPKYLDNNRSSQFLSRSPALHLSFVDSYNNPAVEVKLFLQSTTRISITNGCSCNPCFRREPFGRKINYWSPPLRDSKIEAIRNSLILRICSVAIVRRCRISCIGKKFELWVT